MGVKICQSGVQSVSKKEAEQDVSYVIFRVLKISIFLRLCVKQKFGLQSCRTEKTHQWRWMMPGWCLKYRSPALTSSHRKPATISTFSSVQIVPLKMVSVEARFWFGCFTDPPWGETTNQFLDPSSAFLHVCYLISQFSAHFSCYFQISLSCRTF